MPFKVTAMTTVEHFGQRDESTFNILLDNGTTVVGTIGWQECQHFSFVIDEEHLPTGVQTVTDSERSRLFEEELEFVKKFDDTRRDPSQLAWSITNRKDFTAFLSGVVVGEELVATVNKVPVILGVVIGFEGSA